MRRLMQMMKMLHLYHFSSILANAATTFYIFMATVEHIETPRRLSSAGAEGRTKVVLEHVLFACLVLACKANGFVADPKSRRDAVGGLDGMYIDTLMEVILNTVPPGSLFVPNFLTGILKSFRRRVPTLNHNLAKLILGTSRLALVHADPPGLVLDGGGAWESGGGPSLCSEYDNVFQELGILSSIHAPNLKRALERALRRDRQAASFCSLRKSDFEAHFGVVCDDVADGTVLNALEWVVSRLA